MNRLGIEMLSFHGLPILEQVGLAARLGCAHISSGLTQLPEPFNPFGFPDWSLRDDPQLRREMIAAPRDHEVSISLGEGFGIRPQINVAQRERDVDIMAELGARGLGAVCMEPDNVRAIEELALLTEMAAARDMLVTLEFGPGLAIANCGQALAALRAVDMPNFKLLIDSMHFFRSGGTVAEIAAVDPTQIGYVQLCDVPLMSALPSYMDEAMNARLAPGAGELPLAEFVAVLPHDIPFGLEIPNIALAGAVPDPAERLQPAVVAARNLLKIGE
ncbi:sugar phosphate isomerase/epimerase family protein [Sphingorhabdus sp. M41]|uniref:sugar phosphate isomerase/epimerase family protein n=1 Tax=Sphingorhabdus sp. M41 TaxID=1806885 RepID=UPI00078BBAB0|nr:TIM barrel protein [Sphingorhabdus sp. M41]AMO73146.1 hypothetical protein AZE99_00865 [Sphingorhabdus sp. M41]